ncbi:hypothetical protein [Mesorhizobium loti]|uniref:DUF3800 domain-containing protein n=1 Tax=Mesorhizobium loti R88b TaxID=935548 RepID=A0A6M7WXB2_RHILI|nr:hypothetical protein [Mesorhizobium loti]QKD05259.1 hypothetical protein EB235_30370 [Mesorhizobium loti R88b]
MRFVFVDDAGTSIRDPKIVVSAIVVQAEEQLIRLENRMTRLIQKHIPAEERSSFSFEARDILSGSGHFDDREKWPVERRMAIMDELATVPTEMEIPILFGLADRRKHQWMDVAENTEMDVLRIALHAMAFVSCAFAVERTMRSAYSDEIAQLIAQDTHDAQLLIRYVHDWYQNPIALERLGSGRSLLPLTHIKPEVQFAEKAASLPLQLASFCSFIIGGKFIGNEGIDELYRKIAPVLIADAKHDWRPARSLGLAQET